MGLVGVSLRPHISKFRKRSTVDQHDTRGSERKGVCRILLLPMQTIGLKIGNVPRSFRAGESICTTWFGTLVLPCWNPSKSFPKPRGVQAGHFRLRGRVDFFRCLAPSLPRSPSLPPSLCLSPSLSLTHSRAQSLLTQAQIELDLCVCHSSSHRGGPPLTRSYLRDAHTRGRRW